MPKPQCKNEITSDSSLHHKREVFITQTQYLLNSPSLLGFNPTKLKVGNNPNLGEPAKTPPQAPPTLGGPPPPPGK